MQSYQLTGLLPGDKEAIDPDLMTGLRKGAQYYALYRNSRSEPDFFRNFVRPIVAYCEILVRIHSNSDKYVKTSHPLCSQRNGSLPENI